MADIAHHADLSTESGVNLCGDERSEIKEKIQDVKDKDGAGAEVFTDKEADRVLPKLTLLCGRSNRRRWASAK